MEDLLSGKHTYDDIKGKPELRIRAFHQFLHFLTEENIAPSGKLNKDRLIRLGLFIQGLDEEGYRDLAIALIKKLHLKKTAEGKQTNIVQNLFKYGPPTIKELMIKTSSDIANQSEDY